STATSAGTASVTRSVADWPAASPSGRTQSSVPPRPSSLAPVSSHTSPTACAGSESSHVADTSSSSAGRVSVSVASSACAPPWFVTVIVYVSSSPPWTDSASAVLTTRRSGESTGTRSSSTLSSRSVSVVEVVTVTRLVTSGNEAGVSTAVTSMTASSPAASVPSSRASSSSSTTATTHVRPSLALSTSVRPSKVRPAGRASRSTTSAASAGPWFVTVSVKTTVSPTRRTASSCSLVTERFVSTSGVLVSSSGLLLGSGSGVVAKTPAVFVTSSVTHEATSTSSSNQLEA